MKDLAGKMTFSPYRVEAMNDGIYAVAMTLLVIELKFPEYAEIHSAETLARAMAELSPKFLSWVISFMVLALFWIAHHRMFSHLRHVNGRLVGLSVFQLAFVSLMPFCTMLIGEYGGSLLSQVIYSSNMVLLAICSLLIVNYIHRHPELSSAPMSRGAYRGALMRNLALIVISVVAVGAGFVTVPAIGNAAYALMAIVMPLSRRLERRIDRTG